MKPVPLTPRKLFLFLLLFFLSTPPLLAQNEANVWHFGIFAGLDFNGANPVAITGGAMNTQEGCATICDGITGQLLFYTDGISVWNRNHIVMPNGTGLTGHSSSTQSGLIVPQPGSPNLYYVFTVAAAFFPGGMSYSVVDMNLQGGFGDVTGIKNISLLAEGTEKVTSACHANGTDYWVVTHAWNNANFHAYHLSSTGLNTTPVVSSGVFNITGNQGSKLGQLKISPDGTKIAHCTWTGNTLEVCDFNNSTGQVSNCITLLSAGEEYATEFSPDGTKLYYASCCVSPNTLVQFDLSSGNLATINASKTTIGGGNGFPGRGSLQLGPDNKIYCALLTSNHLGVINNPNNLGAACNYVEVGLPLAGGTGSQIGLPNFVPCLVTVLPMDLSFFQASENDQGQVVLDLEFAQWNRNHSYRVEHSTDGAYFQSIGSLDPDLLTSNQGLAQFVDHLPTPGENYYRIATTDVNGEEIVSRVEHIRLGGATLNKVTTYPNPAQDQLRFSFNVLENQRQDWNLVAYSLEGQQVLEVNWGELSAGRNEMEVDVRSMRRGTYFFHLTCGAYKQVEQIVLR